MQAVREQHHERGADVRVVEEREEVEDGQEGHVEGREGGLGGVEVVLAAVDLQYRSKVNREKWCFSFTFLLALVLA